MLGRGRHRRIWGFWLLLGSLSAAGAQDIDDLLASGRLDEARTRIDARLARHPRDAEALLQRSTLRYLSGDDVGGRADLLAALEHDPGLRQAWLHRGALALAEDDPASAVTAFRRARDLDPRAADGALNLGAALLLSGDADAAGLEFAAYLELSGGSAEDLYLVASNYALAGQATPAVEHLRRAIAADERQRRRARTDPRWQGIADDPEYVQVLEVAPAAPPAGFHVAQRSFPAPYGAGTGPLLPAVLTALQVLDLHFEPEVEVTTRWASIQADARILVGPAEDGGSGIQLSAAPTAFTAEAWESWSRRLLQEVELQMMRSVAPPRPAPPLAPDPVDPTP